MHLTALLSIWLLAPLANAHEWEQIYEKDSVKVSRADMEDSKLYAFKGDTVMDAELGRVLYVILDNDHRIEWVSRLAHNQVLTQSSDFDYVIYQVFDLPAIFADRDYVYHGVATRNPDTGVVTLDMESTEHPDAPETVGVRAQLVNSRYVLTPIAPDKTRVEVEIMTDPKGMMPAWLVNLIQKSWPLDTLSGVRGQLDKEYTGVHALPGMADPVQEEPQPAVVESDTAEPDGEPVTGEDEAEPVTGEDEAEPAEESSDEAVRRGE